MDEYRLLSEWEGMTAIRRIIEDDAADYDRWFDDYAEICHTQLRLLARAVQPNGRGQIGALCRAASHLLLSRSLCAYGKDGEDTETRGCDWYWLAPAVPFRFV